MNKFDFPEHYNWPFFFTVQEHAETRQKQLEMWSELILSYHKTNNIWKITRTEFLAGIGKNPKVNRILSKDDAETVFEYMKLKGKATLSPLSTGVLLLLWRTLAEWEDFIYDSVVRQQKLDSLETLDYIVSDEENYGEEFFGMDKDLLVIILQNLEKKGKCRLIKDESGEYVAVKFS